MVGREHGNAPCEVLQSGVSKGMLPVKQCGWGEHGNASCETLPSGVSKGMLPVKHYCWR